jgi:hypothetical protein
MAKQGTTITTIGPGSNRTTTTTIEELPVKIVNKTSVVTVMSADKKTKTTTENVTLLPGQRLYRMLLLDPLFVLTNQRSRL